MLELGANEAMLDVAGDGRSEQCRFLLASMISAKTRAEAEEADAPETRVQSGCEAT